ncbi:osteoclast stimulatory transmembrane protein [Gadus macrocephalus]|uniref:osteoclast stimulatory transmembrane protein n=1 Tax=Gadus macrocephalus TaxID=80720 RepID=UPI0028CB8314|nr:osteoclast stimulatory transmembrane protein [Gadus macrocephalus]
MTSFSESFRFALLFSEKLKSVLSHLWRVYSAPSVVGQDVLTLVSLCSGIAIATAGLLYYWLSVSLRYDPQASVPIACTYSAVIFLLLVLCHPLRCVATMAMLSLFTKQGRKLVISTSFVILIFNVVPNITINIGAAVHILKCTSEGFAQSLLNSSGILNSTKHDLVKETFKAIKNNVKLKDTFFKLDNFMQIDMSEVKSRFTNTSVQIESDFLHARYLVKDYKLLFNRALAALFIFLFILQSARYLKLYLTSLHFENEYLEKQTIQHSPESSVGEKCTSKKKRRSGEWHHGLMSMAVVTLYFTAMTFVVVLDHVVFHIVDLSVPWILDLPSTPASIQVNFTTWSFVPAQCLWHSWCKKNMLTHFQRNYSWAFTINPSLCHVRPSAPDVGVRVLLASLWLLSYFFVLLEVLARRMRRRVAASFFQKQEERRAAFLLEKVREMRKKKTQEIFSVSAASCV